MGPMRAARHAAGVADAVQIGGVDPARRLLRAEVGRLPVDLLPRRRRGRAGQPQRAADDPLLPRTGRGGHARNCPIACVIDGEIIIATDHGLDFEALQQRIHPADSRVRMLAEQTPASFIAFDLLALGDDDYTRRPFSERRAALVDALAGSGPSIHVTPATTDLATAQRWFSEFEGAGLDGVVAKPLTITYQPDKRIMFKIKHERTADCVVAGYRVHKSGDGRDRLAAARALQRRRHARIGRRHRRLPDGQAAAAVHRIAAARHHLRRPSVELGRPHVRRPHADAETKAPAGTPARTCRSCRCDPSGSSRSATTTWKANGSATPRSSTAGAPTATHARAPTTQLEQPVTFSLGDIVPGLVTPPVSRSSRRSGPLPAATTGR